MSDFRWSADEIDLEDYIEDMRGRKDAAYKERDMVLALAIDALCAHGLHCWMGRHEEADAAWENDWRNIVYVELPNGQQLSWHIHDSEVAWFPRLEREDTPWDGHTTEEKYERLLYFIGIGHEPGKEHPEEEGA